MDKTTLDHLKRMAGIEAPALIEKADSSKNNMYQINEGLKAVKDTCADDELEEGAKPDFADIDGDGDKEETAKKAADDADDVKNESQQMRAWAESVYKPVESLEEGGFTLNHDVKNSRVLKMLANGQDQVTLDLRDGTDEDTHFEMYQLKRMGLIDFEQIGTTRHGFEMTFKLTKLENMQEESTEEVAENAKATSLGKSAHKDHKRQPTSDPRLMHLMNNDGMRDSSSFNQSPYLKAWLAGYDSMEKNERNQMREWSNSVNGDTEDRGHVTDQPDGETIDLSLRRYLDADPMKVSVQEDIKAKDLIREYKQFKG
jgi:hypothetical protein